MQPKSLLAYGGSLCNYSCATIVLTRNWGYLYLFNKAIE